ncbi:MAG TPA: BON domain-containing protein [Gaiellaceae bacterium]|nr:BON domain-containing protein [Gaiellaceae bacterium]
MRRALARRTIEGPRNRNAKEAAMAEDAKLVEAVKEELIWEPRVDPAAVAVYAEDGRVTLRGSVGSPREKRDAGNAAARVLGVVSVDNELDVSVMTAKRREDADLRADVLQALMLDSLVPDTVDAIVHDGVVTLTGAASWQYQRDEAERVAEHVSGVVKVVDEIVLERPDSPRSDDVHEEIARAFRRSAVVDAAQLRVTTEDGVVTISGKVRSWAEHDDALAAAWAAPGVVEVRDDVTVEY